MFAASGLLGTREVKLNLPSNLPHPHASEKPRLMAQKETRRRADLSRYQEIISSSHSTVSAVYLPTAFGHKT